MKLRINGLVATLLSLSICLSACSKLSDRVLPGHLTAASAHRHTRAIPPGGFNPDCVYTYLNVSGDYDPNLDTLTDVTCNSGDSSPFGGGSGSNTDPGYQYQDDTIPYGPATSFQANGIVKLIELLSKLIKTWKIGRPQFGKRLNKHFRDHGRDFQAQNKADYAQKSQDFLQTATSQSNSFRIKWNQQDQTIRIYDPVTNTFGAYSEQGTTRTFFKPAQGESYFEQQTGIEIPKRPQGVAIVDCVGQCSPDTSVSSGPAVPPPNPNDDATACAYAAIRQGFGYSGSGVVETTTPIDDVEDGPQDPGFYGAVYGLQYYRVKGDLGTCIWGQIVTYGDYTNDPYGVGLTDGKTYFWTQ